MKATESLEKKINTTWKTVLKFWIKSTGMFLQMSCNTSHSCCRFTGALFTFFFSMYVHTCSMFISGLWAGQFRIVKLSSRFLFSRYFLNILAVCLGSLSCWKTKLLLIRAFSAWYVSICLYLGAVRLSVILYRCPTPSPGDTFLPVASSRSLVSSLLDFLLFVKGAVSYFTHIFFPFFFLFTNFLWIQSN